MRAVVVRSHGGPEVLQQEDVDEPTPGAGELLVEVAASGVNYIDTYQRTGAYPLPLPVTLGLEGAGRVLAVGEGVTEFAVGDRVAWGNTLGSYAERAVVPVRDAVAVPDGVDIEVAAGALLQGMTAHYLTHSTYPVREGDTVLVHAAAGGMGLALTQMVKALGGRVIGTVSTEEKERLAREAGADEVIRYTELGGGEELAAEVRRLTDGEGVPVVYDGVGATTFDASLASLRRRGVLALFGAASGPVPPVDPQRLNRAGSVFLTRPTLADHVATREELTWRAGDVFRAIAEGSLTIHIGHRYPLGEARTAHEDLQGRRTTGKLLLLPR
ncbi:NADPH2:quinone reductase [Streptoalloteichus tenebrarius]|uniref:NADPH2:quinone reductase n=1 Tax=Streptoalloteichus tenebrarius (strain ATCC 17920 / DSM 40477 / JCM 4838 / CBS 697.72 / NBRC 16177 / NCIMB 11028 / NRRL B-12390 / A12253. 1 / ISP 5477) TaxID=1933 RepID=A0ABT1HSV6_STRSD|nr:quinone oxidoreductase [Streptoalloteichus tenebrarius]MCP2258576.1 NADPH2:quinone reductase [Streptoalloteichus tenebrarius]